MHFEYSSIKFLFLYTEFERRLRSLRQEHEKVKTQYEDRIKSLQQLQASSATKNIDAASGTHLNTHLNSLPRLISLYHPCMSASLCPHLHV